MNLASLSMITAQTGACSLISIVLFIAGLLQRLVEHIRLHYGGGEHNWRHPNRQCRVLETFSSCPSYQALAPQCQYQDSIVHFRPINQGMNNHLSATLILPLLRFSFRVLTLRRKVPWGLLEQLLKALFWSLNAWRSANTKKQTTGETTFGPSIHLSIYLSIPFVVTCSLGTIQRLDEQNVPARTPFRSQSWAKNRNSREAMFINF